MSRRSESLRRKWQDQEFRARAVTGMREAAARPERRAQLLALCVRNNADPATLDKMSAARKAAWVDPSKRAYTIARVTAGVNRPEVRARRRKGNEFPKTRDGIYAIAWRKSINHKGATP